MLACSGTNLAIMPSTTIAFALLRWTHAGPAGPTLGCAVAAPAGAAAVLAGFAGGAAGFFGARAAHRKARRDGIGPQDDRTTGAASRRFPGARQFRRRMRCAGQPPRRAG